MTAGQGNLGALEEGANRANRWVFLGNFQIQSNSGSKRNWTINNCSFFRRAPWSSTWSIATGGRGCGSTSMDGYWVILGTIGYLVVECVFLFDSLKESNQPFPQVGTTKTTIFQNAPFVSFDVIWNIHNHLKFLALPGPGKPRKPLTLQWLWWFAKFWWRARILPRHKGRFEGSKDHWWMEMDRNQHVF